MVRSVALAVLIVASSSCVWSSGVVFRPFVEPRERAFTVLVPQGWQARGGLFHVDPTAMGGPANSIMPKCDLVVASPDGAAYVHFLPSWSFADFSRNPQAMGTAMLFPPGRLYAGMVVRPKPDVTTFLRQLFAERHPGASGVVVRHVVPLPDVVREYLRVTSPGPMASCEAGAVILDYVEGGTKFTEAIWTVLVDTRVAALSWGNDRTGAMRAPASRVAELRPVLDTVRLSVRLDEGWLARLAQAAGQRGATAADVMRRLQEIDAQMNAASAANRQAIQHENYLLLTQQDEYRNPFTGATEVGTSAYRRRWQTAAGALLLTDDEAYDPNQDQTMPRTTWRVAAPRPR